MSLQTLTPVEPGCPSCEADTPVLRILEEFLVQLEHGDAITPEELVSRHPEHAAALHEYLASLNFLHRAALNLRSRAEAPQQPLAPRAEELGQLGDFRLLRELGRGGMGIVYEAEQISLGRRVALKILPFAAALDRRQLQRFRNEAHAAAQLHHTNIVPVYAVGTERGVHYYAMQFIEGRTLAVTIAEQRRLAGRHAIEELPTGPAAPASARTQTATTDTDPKGQAAPSTERSNPTPAYIRTVAGLGAQAAYALEHAHQLGVIHRDIKPANLLVDERGNLWITDFGLAQVQSDTRLTISGDLVGTLRYMSPEQALAKRVVIDHRTDIYSLGATLYELLTLEPAFNGRDRQELLRQIAFDEPRPLRRFNKAIPAELETVVLKAVSKNPDERYATAKELADDLNRFLEDKPIRAKRPTLLQRLRKFIRRHKLVVSLVGVFVVALLVLTAVALWVSMAQIRGALQDKTQALDREREALEDKTQALDREKVITYLQRTALAERQLAAGNVGPAEKLLEECAEHLRGWEWHLLKRQRYDGQPTSMPHSATVTRVAFSPNGRQVASACYDGTFQIWDAHTRRKLYDLEQQTANGHPVIVRGMAYSPDGRYLALARDDGLIVVWDPTRGQLLHSLIAHQPKSAWQVAFSPDSRTLASGGLDNSVRLWDMTTGKAIRVFSDHPGAVKGVAFRPDGRSLVAACDDGTVKVWDPDTGRQTFSFHGELRYPFYPWFSPDTRRLAWSCLDGVMNVWDTTTGRLEITQQTNTYQLRAVAFHPDGKRMALAGFDGTVRLLDAATGREMLTLFAHPSIVACAAFSHDGNKIATGSYDHTVRIWDATPLEPDPQAGYCVTLTGHEALVNGVAFSPDRRWLATASWDGTVKLWELGDVGPASRAGPAAEVPLGKRDLPRAITLRYTLRGHSGNLSSVAFSPDKRTLASGSWDKTVKLWELPLTPPSPPGGEGIRFAPSPPGGEGKGEGGDSLAELRTISCAAGVTSIAFSPDGQLLAIGQTNGIRLYDPASGKEVTRFKTPAAVPALAFTPDSQYLGSAGASDPAIKFWGVAGSKMNFEIRHYSNASVAISPDGRLIAAPSRLQAAAGPTVKIWEVLDWDAKTSKTPYKERYTLTGHAGKVGKVTFSPDGRYLASGSWDSTIKVWDLKALADDPKAEPVTLRGHAGAIYGLAFSPDGRRLATGSGSANHGEVKVWDSVLWGK